MATPIEQVIGENIKKRRTELGMSQSELGREVGMYFGTDWPAQTVSAAEKGRRQFIAAEVMVLSLILHCRIQDLFTPDPPVAIKLTEHYSTSPDYSTPLDSGGITDEVLRKRFSETRALLRGAKGQSEQIQDLAEKLESQVGIIDQWMTGLQDANDDPEGVREKMERPVLEAGGGSMPGHDDA